MTAGFVGEPLRPLGDFDAATIARGEPALPNAFAWRDETLTIATVKRAWKSTKTDRGDVYVKRHSFEVALADGRTAVIYFDRQAKRGAERWWLYTLTR